MNQRSSGGLPFMRRVAIIFASAFATLFVAALLVLAWAAWTYAGSGPAPAQTTIVLRKGSSLPEIAAALERGGAVRSSSVFIVAAELTRADRTLRAGEYEFPAHASMAQVLDKIRHGKVIRHAITLPEGIISAEVARRLNAEPALVGIAPTPPEGAILPETYDFERGEDRAAVLKRMMDARDALLAQLWAKRQPGLPFSTPEEAVILASIVEKETGKPDERPKVAAVFVNRLRKGMKLESDPTIIYGLTGGVPLGHGLRVSELARPNPYSTYQIVGLPPGPIANPGRAALAAVLDPANTDDIFFVADGTGGHVFAATLEEHNRNVAAWRGIEAGRKGPVAATPLDVPTPAPVKLPALKPPLKPAGKR